MDRIRRDRLILFILSIACISISVESLVLRWEYWVPPLLLLGIVGLWIMHVTQQVEEKYRSAAFFLYAFFMLCFVGVHKNACFEVTVAVLLLIAVFSLMERILFLNVLLFEYAILILLQILLYFPSNMAGAASLLAKTILQVVLVLCMYGYSRVAIGEWEENLKELKKREQELREYDEDMEDFLSNISHELRTPVNVVNGMSTLLLRNNRSGKELMAIREAGIRLSHQIEDIQDYTEIKLEQLVIENESYMIISLMNDVVEYFNRNERAEELELVVDLDPTVPTMMQGDIRKLHKLFRHLIDNAIKFTRRGGIYIHVFTNPREYGVNLCIEITDTGIGMTGKELSRLNKGMYQANKKRNRSTGGIGIGLPVVYGFVHNMGGFVRIESTKAVGTTVSVSIPQEVINPTPCLSVNPDFSGDIVFFVRPEKYEVPQVREFYRTTAINIATGIRVRLFSVNDEPKLKSLLEEIHVSHIFMGQEEYEQYSSFMLSLAKAGYTIVVSANKGFTVPKNSGVIVMPKPLYGFPVVRVLNAEIGNEMTAAETREHPRYPGIRALVVDDEPMNLVVATGLFREYGMEIDTAESGREALLKYESGNYDIIFMDHMMPEMDGVEAMRHLRKKGQETGRSPVIVALTANALSGAREMFLQEGFDGFIAKPIDITEFERVMRHVLPMAETEQNG